MTNIEIYELFCDRFNIKSNDYRPLAKDMFTKGREGITVFCDNGDIILYFPKTETEIKQMSADDVMKFAENMKNNRPTESVADELKTWVRNYLASADVVEVNHGEWKKKPERVVSYGDIYNINIRYCSECGWEIRNPGWLKCEWNFCPNCGADMRGKT